MNAKDEPKNAGTRNLVIRWKMRVPIPAKRRVVETGSPVIAGTRIVAPNIANMCCNPRVSIFGLPNVLASKIGCWLICDFDIKTGLLNFGLQSYGHFSVLQNKLATFAKHFFNRLC